MLDMWTGCSRHLPLTAGDEMPVSGPLLSMKPNRAVFQEGNAAAAISKKTYLGNKLLGGTEEKQKAARKDTQTTARIGLQHLHARKEVGHCKKAG